MTYDSSASASSGLGYDLEIFQDKFPGETLNYFLRLRSRGDIEVSIPLNIIQGQNCFDVEYHAKNMDDVAFPVVYDTKTINIVVPRIPADAPDVYQLINFNQRVKIVRENADNCPY